MGTREIKCQEEDVLDPTTTGATHGLSIKPIRVYCSSLLDQLHPARRIVAWT